MRERRRRRRVPLVERQRERPGPARRRWARPGRQTGPSRVRRQQATAARRRDHDRLLQWLPRHAAVGAAHSAAANAASIESVSPIAVASHLSTHRLRASPVYPHESVKLNGSSLGWNAPFTTTPVWIVNVSTREARALRPGHGKGARVAAEARRRLAVVDADHWRVVVRIAAARGGDGDVVHPNTRVRDRERPNRSSIAPLSSTAAHALTVGRSSAELSPMRL